MKTFLFDTFNKYKRLSESLDVETTLCNRTWVVFNNSGEKEIYIFQAKGKLLISLNGKVTHATWEYIPANKSLIISGNNQSYMVHAAYVDNILFALNIDGTNEYAFLIDENNKQNFLPQSYNDIKLYFQAKEQKKLQKEKYEKIKNKHILAQKRELERIEINKQSETRIKENDERRIADLRKRAENIITPNSYIPLVYIIPFTVGVISTFLFLILTLPSNLSLMDNLGIFCSFTILGFLLTLLGFYLIGKRNARKWKETHPNDPVNEYL